MPFYPTDQSPLADPSPVGFTLLDETLRSLFCGSFRVDDALTLTSDFLGAIVGRLD